MRDHCIIARRNFLAGGLAVSGIGVAGSPQAHVQSSAGVSPTATARSGDIRTRAIPRTNEMVTALGLGTFMTFDLLPGADRQPMAKVLQTYFAGGSRLVDTSPLYGSAEVTVGALLAQLPPPADLFVANKIWATGEYLGDTSHATASLEQSKLRLWRPRMDLMQCHSITNASTIIPLLRAWKNEGHVRYVGVTHHESQQQGELTRIVETGDVDMVQTNYSIFSRSAEERLLPAAASKGVGVLINMPLEKARLMHIAWGRSIR